MPTIGTVAIPLSDMVDTVEIIHTDIFGGIPDRIYSEAQFTPDAYTKLVCPFDGADASQTLVDTNTPPKTITAVPGTGVCELDTAWKNKGTASLRVSGGGYAEIDNSTDFDMSASDATMEFSIKPNSLPSDGALVLGTYNSSNDAQTFIYTYTNGKIAIGKAGVSELATAAGVMVIGQKHDVMVTRTHSTSTTKIYVNGVEKASGTGAYWATYNGAKKFRIGAANASMAVHDFWIDNLRISKGIVRPRFGTILASTSPAALAKSLPVGTVIKWSTARVVIFKDGVPQTAASTDWKGQKAINGGAYNGTWLTLAAFQALSDDTITTATNSVKILGQYNSNEVTVPMTGYYMYVDVEISAGGGGGISKARLINSGGF